MKKIAFILSGALLAFGCSKEDNLSTENGVNYTRTLIENWESFDYEYFEYPDNPQDLLQGYFDVMETGDALPNKSIEETVWIMESGLNLLNPHPVLIFDETLTQELELNLTLDDENWVNGDDITAKFTDFYNFVESNKPVNHVYLVNDVIVKEINAGANLKLGISVLWAEDPTTLAAGQTANGPLPAQGQREALTNNFCGTSSGTASKKTAQYVGKNLAFNGYKKTKFGNQQPFHPYWSTNDFTFNSDNSGAPNFVDPNNLFGGNTSVIPSYAGPSPNVCLSEADQDAYAAEIFDLLLFRGFGVPGNKPKRVTEVNVTVPPLLNGNGAWQYGDIIVTEWQKTHKPATFEPSI